MQVSLDNLNRIDETEHFPKLEISAFSFHAGQRFLLVNRRIISKAVSLEKAGRLFIELCRYNIQ